MLGFQRFAHAAITIAGIELVHQIQKGQFDVTRLCSLATRTPTAAPGQIAAAEFLP